MYLFAKKKQLLNEWVNGYNRTLKPGLKQNRYRFLDKDIRFTHVGLPEDAYWGGAVAAEMLTDYLIADTGIIYTDMPFTDLMKALRLIPDKTGNITLIETFWKTGRERENMVDFILVYADLIESGDPRYMETAETIFNKYVQDYL